MNPLVIATVDLHVGRGAEVDAYRLTQALESSARSLCLDATPACIRMRREKRVHAFLTVSSEPGAGSHAGGAFGLLWHHHGVGKQAVHEAAKSCLRTAGLGTGFWKGATDDDTVIRVLHSRQRDDLDVPSAFVRLDLLAVATAGRGIPSWPEVSDARAVA